MRGFLQGWYHDCGERVIVDKNRAWLHAVELLLHIEPDARLIVCLRELGQVYGSIEAQHRRTFSWISSITWPITIVLAAQIFCSPRTNPSLHR